MDTRFRGYDKQRGVVHAATFSVTQTADTLGITGCVTAVLPAPFCPI